MTNTNHDNGKTPRAHSGRETFLAFVLLFIFGGTFFIFMVIATGGFIFYVLMITAALGLFVGLHYLLWGYLFSQEVEKEKEEMELEESAQEQWKKPQSWERRF